MHTAIVIFSYRITSLPPFRTWGKHPLLQLQPPLFSPCIKFLESEFILSPPLSSILLTLFSSSQQSHYEDAHADCHLFLSDHFTPSLQNVGKASPTPASNPSFLSLYKTPGIRVYPLSVLFLYSSRPLLLSTKPPRNLSHSEFKIAEMLKDFSTLLVRVPNASINGMGHFGNTSMLAECERIFSRAAWEGVRCQLGTI